MKASIIYNEDLGEYIGDFNTEEYSLSITIGENAEVIRKQTESSIKYGITVESRNSISQWTNSKLHVSTTLIRWFTSYNAGW